MEGGGLEGEGGGEEGERAQFCFSCSSQGWDEDLILLLLRELSLMDTNNFVDKCGAGEREGRENINTYNNNNEKVGTITTSQ